MDIVEISKNGLDKEIYTKEEVKQICEQYLSLIFRLEDVMLQEQKLLKKAIN